MDIHRPIDIPYNGRIFVHSLINLWKIHIKASCKILCIYLLRLGVIIFTLNYKQTDIIQNGTFSFQIQN